MCMRDILLLGAISFFSISCAGREPNPISCYMPGDENLGCEAIKEEIEQLQSEMLKLLPKTDKTFTNALWYAGGQIAIVPLFFIDMKDAERIEYEAFRRRHNRLLIMANKKNCDMGEIKAEPIPTLEQRKVIKEEEKKKEQKAPDS